MEPRGSTFFFAFALFVLAAPLVKGGNRALPLLLLELASAAFLVVTVVAPGARVQIPWALWTAIAILVIYPLVQLLPLPASLWAALPGHDAYVQMAQPIANADGSGSWRALSVIPSATEYGWLALLPPLACLFATLRLTSEQVTRLLLAMVVFAGLEALLGLLQVGAGAESVFYFRTERAVGTAVGTFANRNHFAGLLAMTLPVVVGLLSFNIRHERRRHRHKHRFNVNVNVFSQGALLFATAVLILLGLAFSRSRAGIATALIGLGCSSYLLVRARGGVRHAHVVVAAIVAVGILLALAIGVAPIIERLTAEQLELSAQDRLNIYMASVRAGLAFLPFGSGLSTFPSVFPQFQTTALAGFVNYAHNDYLQAFVEMGLVAAVGVGFGLVAYINRLGALVRLEVGRSFTIVQIAAGIGLLPMLVHSLFDFGLHIPAVAMWFGTLAGVLFHRGAEPLGSGYRSKASTVPGRGANG